MKKICLVLCLVCLVSSVALAQGKTNVQWKCDKPSLQNSIPVGDKPGHAYAIEQINCTAMKGDIAGNKMKSGVGTEFLYLKGDEVTGTVNSSKAWRTAIRTSTNTNFPAS